MFISIATVLVCTILIWKVSELLSEQTDWIGKRFNIAPSVRGATLDAVSSSSPEFFTVVAALMAGSFEAGAGAIAGSALFNILVIPALSSFATGGLPVHHSVVKRDGVMYLLVVAFFIGALYFGKANGDGYHLLSGWEGWVMIGMYVVYIIGLIVQSWNYSSDEKVEGSVIKHIGFALVTIALIGVGCHFMVEAGLELAHHYGMSEAVLGVTILAAATSLPDALISVLAAKRGDADGAIANAFASNSFDILICLGVPVAWMGGIQMEWVHSQWILYCLAGSTVFAVVFMITDWTLTRTESVIKIVLWLAFCTAAFMGIF